MDATGHSYGSWKQTKAPTCTEKGRGTRECYCGYIEDYDLAALGHTYQIAVTAPTCTEQGYTTHTCERCGDSYVDSYVDALGHSWDEGVVTKEPTVDAEGEKTCTCARCGETKTEILPKLPDEKPDVLLGDVNGDGRVNARDVRALLRYIAGLNESGTINEAAADFNGDGRINARDARALLRHIAGLD